jgi:hypothetical protein
MADRDTERDEEGRPVAQPNAGAFLAPFQGVPPVPSSVIDQRGASVEHPSEAEIERGQAGAGTEPASRAATATGAWWLSASVSIAVWSIA